MNADSNLTATFPMNRPTSRRRNITDRECAADGVRMSKMNSRTTEPRYCIYAHTIITLRWLQHMPGIQFFFLMFFFCKYEIGAAPYKYFERNMCTRFNWKNINVYSQNDAFYLWKENIINFTQTLRCRGMFSPVRVWKWNDDATATWERRQCLFGISETK